MSDLSSAASTVAILGNRCASTEWLNALCESCYRLIGANFLDEFTQTGIIKNVLTKRSMQGQPASSSRLAVQVAHNFLRERTLREVEGLWPQCRLA